MWMLVVVVGFAAAMGYGVTRGFIELPVAAFIVFLVLAAVLSSSDVTEVVEVEIAIPEPMVEAEPVRRELPIGFHPTG
jgi:uncharacterized membrane protein